MDENNHNSLPYLRPWETGYPFGNYNNIYNLNYLLNQALVRYCQFNQQNNGSVRDVSILF